MKFSKVSVIKAKDLNEAIELQYGLKEFDCAKTVFLESIALEPLWVSEKNVNLYQNLIEKGNDDLETEHTILILTYLVDIGFNNEEVIIDCRQ